MQRTTTRTTNTGVPLIALVAVILSACGGAESESSGGGGGGLSSAGGGGDCNYNDELSANERETANQCGQQASSQVALADGLLDSAIRNCQAGETAAAEEIYNSQYLVQVDRTERVIEEICGGTADDGGSGSSDGVDTGGDGGIGDPSDAEYYNLCIGQDTEFYYAGCYGEFRFSDNTCPSSDTPTYNGNFSSLSACTEARDNYLNSVGG